MRWWHLSQNLKKVSLAGSQGKLFQLEETANANVLRLGTLKDLGISQFAKALEGHKQKVEDAVREEK